MYLKIDEREYLRLLNEEAELRAMYRFRVDDEWDRYQDAMGDVEDVELPSDNCIEFKGK